MKKPSVRTVLTMLSIFGVGATGVLAAYGGIKTKDAIDNHGLSTKDKKELIKKVSKYYIPAATVGVATGVCIVKSHRLSSAEIAALTATCSYLAANRDYIEKQLKEHVGEEKLEAIKKKFTYAEMIDHDFNKYPAELTGHGDVLFFDGYAGRIFRSNIDSVNAAIEAFKLSFEGDEDTPRNYVCLNDFYDLLGIKQTHFGNQMGWIPDIDWCEPTIEFKVSYVNYSGEKLNKKDLSQLYDVNVIDDIILGFENIGEPFYVIEIMPNSYPVPYWDQI